MGDPERHVAPSEKLKTMLLKALLAACYLTALQSCAACRDLPGATPFQHFQLLNSERRRSQAAHARPWALGAGQSPQPREEQDSRINQQPNQSCSTNSRLNEAHRFVSGLIEFLIELHWNGNVNSSLIRHQRTHKAEMLWTPQPQEKLDPEHMSSWAAAIQYGRITLSKEWVFWHLTRCKLSSESLLECI